MLYRKMLQSINGESKNFEAYIEHPASPCLIISQKRTFQSVVISPVLSRSPQFLVLPCLSMPYETLSISFIQTQPSSALFFFSVSISLLRFLYSYVTLSPVLYLVYIG